MKNDRIVVLFPGINYGTDCPLLYYAGVKFASAGYERIEVKYAKNMNSIEECIKEAEPYVLEQLTKYDLNSYKEIVFISKSIGTVLSGWIEEKLDIKVKHIMLTPIKESLKYIKKEKNILLVIAGTEDSHLDSDILKNHCEIEKIKLKQIKGVGHRLEFKEDVDRSIELLREIISWLNIHN